MVPVREQLEAEVQFVTEGMVLLRAGEALGETAVLDAEPRMASVTSVVETQLLRFDQEPLYEVMVDHSEVSRGIIQVLSRYLRARAQELSELRGRPVNLEA